LSLSLLLLKLSIPNVAWNLPRKEGLRVFIPLQEILLCLKVPRVSWKILANASTKHFATIGALIPFNCHCILPFPLVGGF
jgi:hypothetical protein